MAILGSVFPLLLLKKICRRADKDHDLNLHCDPTAPNYSVELAMTDEENILNIYLSVERFAGGELLD